MKSSPPTTILYIFIGLAFIFLFSSCNTTTITKHFIYNTGWNKGGYQGFTIAKIKLLKPGISVFDKDFNRFDLEEYSIDSSFCFIPMPSDNINNVGKVYFDQINKTFKGWYHCGNLSKTKTIIGPLQQNNWYVISGVKGNIDYYVFIDDNEKAHVYSLGPYNF